MNIDANIKFKNNYRLQHIDTITGETLHDLEFHNVVLDQIIDTVQANTEGSGGSFGIAIGSGSGTPSANDTQLFHEIKRFFGTSNGVTGECSEENNNTLLFSVSVTIPAKASEVYDISEVGVCFGYSSTLVTHALILDSEGNPISVKKKDTDKIILNCELYITFESEDIENFDVANFVKGSSYLGTLAIYYNFGAATSLEAERVSTASCKGLWGDDDELIYKNSLSTYNLPRPSWIKDKDARTLTANFGPSRLPEFSMPTYIRGITFGKFGTIKLPNEAIFPRYKVSNIIVGIGDGETTKFKCPLNYFIQESETIRVGLDEKIRNTDYTIDNEANQDELIELSAGNEAIISGGLYSGSGIPLFRKLFGKVPSDSKNYGNFGQDQFDASNPLYLDFKEPAKLNTLRVPSSSEGTFTLFGRNTEEEDWTMIGQFTPNNENNHYNFDLCYYRYIKLTSTTETSRMYEYQGGGYTNRYNTIEKCKKDCYFIGYVGDGIEFTTPPPEGAVITMDAYTDLPFISPNNVLDLSATLTFHF